MNTTRRNLLVGGLFAAGGGALSYRLFQKSHPNALPSPFQLLSPLPDELELPAIQIEVGCCPCCCFHDEQNHT